MGSSGREARRSVKAVAGRWRAPVACSTRVKAAARVGSTKRRARHTSHTTAPAKTARMARRTGVEVNRHRPNHDRAANRPASVRKGASSGHTCSQARLTRARATALAMRVSTVFSKRSPPGCRFTGESVIRLPFCPRPRSVAQTVPKARRNGDCRMALPVTTPALRAARRQASQGAMRSMPIRLS